jgi:hypothetical protein
VRDADSPLPLFSEGSGRLRSRTRQTNFSSEPGQGIHVGRRRRVPLLFGIKTTEIRWIDRQAVDLTAGGAFSSFGARRAGWPASPSRGAGPPYECTPAYPLSTTAGRAARRDSGVALERMIGRNLPRTPAGFGGCAAGWARVADGAVGTGYPVT